jgi:hypothetical protein
MVVESRLGLAEFLALRALKNRWGARARDFGIAWLGTLHLSYGVFSGRVGTLRLSHGGFSVSGESHADASVQGTLVRPSSPELPIFRPLFESFSECSTEYNAS